MAVSLGEAISLQGRNTGAEQLGRAAFQSAQAEAARTAKRAMVGAQQAEKREDKLIDLFRDKSNFHRLVLPEVGDLLTKTLNKMQEIKSSGSPYASNQFDRLYSEAAFQLNSYITASNELKNFDRSADYLDTGKKFYGENLPEFMQVYTKASRLSDLQKYVQEKPGLAADPYLVLTPNGIPQIHEKPAIPFEKMLQEDIKLLKPVVAADQIQSMPELFGKKEYSKAMVTPLTIKDAEAVRAKNTALYGYSRPTSVEDVVDNMLNTPGLIEQVSVRRGLGVRPQADGTYAPEDIGKVKASLMQDAKTMVSTAIKSQIVSPPSSTNINVNATDQAEAFAPQKQLETLNVGVPGEMLNNKKLDQGQYSKGVIMNSYLNYGLGDKIKVASVTPSDKVVDRFGNPLSGIKNDVVVNGLKVMPYVIDGGTRRPANEGDKLSDVKGVDLFIEMSTPTTSIFATWNSNLVNINTIASVNNLKFESMKQIIEKFKSETQRVTGEMKKKTFKDMSELNSFAFNTLDFPTMK